MDSILTRMLVNELKSATGKLERGECHMTNEEGMRFLTFIAHEEMSKEQVLLYLRWSRAKFDQYIKEKKMPRGKKRVGHKELCWYKDEINEALSKLS